MKTKYFDPLTQEPCTRRAYLKAWKAIAAEVGKRLSVDIVGYDELNNVIGGKHRTLALPFWIIRRLYEARSENLPAKTTFDDIMTLTAVSVKPAEKIHPARVAALWAYAHERLRDVSLEALATGRVVYLALHTVSMPYYEVLWVSPKGNKLILQNIRGVECSFKDFVDTGFSLE